MRKTLLAITIVSLGLWAATPTASTPQSVAKATSEIQNPKSKVQDGQTDAITIPRMLSYQGKLLNNSGNPVRDSTYSVLFSLYTVPSGGSSLWSETQSVLTRAGLFSVLLGSVTPIGALPEAGTLYLGMKVGADPEMTPRIQIASAAYAYIARKADTANYALAGGGGSGDNAWVRGTPDSVLYTVNRLGIARGSANNMLYGSFRQSHVNFGVSCTTGASGQDYSNVTVSGGLLNTARAAYSTVGGGWLNRANGVASAVAGGVGNLAGGDYSIAAGGLADTTLALCGGVLSGYLNTAGNSASDTCALVAGGYRNRSTGRFSSVGGGASNAAAGAYATVPGGSNCMANGDYSFAAGRNIQANRRGCFTWSDASPSTISAISENVWLARASGGVSFYTDSSLASGSRLPAGGSSWNPVLDSLNMADFRTVDRQVLLEALARMRVREYSLKSQDPSIRHVGPIAQDFHSLLGYGESNTTINTGDADGVLLAAVQALYEQNQVLNRRVAELEAKLNER